MDRTWYWKAGFIVAATIGAVYALVPSYTYFSLPADQRNDPKVFEAARPKWAPSQHLNLGLDLQGGIHLVMGADAERAVRERAVRRAEEFDAEFERKEIKGVESKGDGETGLVTVSSTDAAALDKAHKIIADEYTDMTFRSSGANSFVVAMKDEAVRQLKEGAVDQAVKAVRNRVDKWGVSEPNIAKRGDSNILIQLPGYSDPERAKELLGRTAHLEFRIVDDETEPVTSITNLPPGIRVDFSSHEGPGGAKVREAFFRSDDRPTLEAFLKEHPAPAQRDWGIHREDDTVKLKTSYRTYLLDKRHGLSGDYVTDARVVFDQRPGEGSRPQVQLTFNRVGAEKFGQLTTENTKRLMAIVLDEAVESAPVINEPITGGICTIHMGGLRPVNEIKKEADDLALVLKNSLPVPVRILEERSVGASLGPELIHRGTLAALLGVFAVLVFMAIYYRFSGLVADVALVLNGLAVLAVMALIDSTLTLPGIAGFVLTLGMAVDANVLINERIREELKAGKTVFQAVSQGYDKVFWTIFDGHVTALVAGFVIRANGSGPVRGFATTLIIGLLASMFTSIVVTRTIVEWFVNHGKLKKAVSF
ncbi:MAG: protein translocase subunit SecD [Deltaproteobacteria bacterium]|nr:protein translocase subunit SecD [Deltaproteobacteria bacterium]